MVKEIPDGSVEIQTGLWLYEYQQTIGGNTYTLRDLYSAENYCFYDLEQPENYDEDGNLKPAEERVYAQYAGLAVSQSSWTYEQINARFISVQHSISYEIL